MRPPGIIASEAPPLQKPYGIRDVEFALSYDLREGWLSTPGRSGAPVRKLASEWAGVGNLTDTDGEAGRSSELRSHASLGSGQNHSARRSAQPDGVGQAGRGRLAPEGRKTAPMVSVAGSERQGAIFTASAPDWAVFQGPRARTAG